MRGTEVALQVWSPPPGPIHKSNWCWRQSGMVPVLALEPLRNGVLALAATVLLLALFLIIERSVGAISRFRINRREPALTRLVYRVLQGTSSPPADFRRLSRFDRRVVRSILLGLALDLRGEAGDAIATLYRQLG